MKIKTNIKVYKFQGVGAFSSRLTELTGKQGLLDCARQIESRAGFSAGFTGCFFADSDDSTREGGEFIDGSFPNNDYAGPGWYLAHFDGHTERFTSEEEALIRYIEERTETNLIA